MLSEAQNKIVVVFVGGVIVGILLWGGLHTTIAMTNSLNFCISCHEMEQTVFQEYKKSIHYSNASGVRATCSDCHVPKQWGPKMIRKVQATNELYHKLMGTIDTIEKFEAKRAELAERVWLSMQQSDSRECRNCHDKEAMDFHKQRRRSAEKMQVAFEKGDETCIDCHKGIAHKLPEGYEDDDD